MQFALQNGLALPLDTHDEIPDGPPEDMDLVSFHHDPDSRAMEDFPPFDLKISAYPNPCGDSWDVQWNQA